MKTSSVSTSISPDVINQLIQERDEHRQQFERYDAALAALGVNGSKFKVRALLVRGGQRGPHRMSAEAREKIAAAQRARWARFHAGKGVKAKGAAVTQKNVKSGVKAYWAAMSPLQRRNEMKRRGMVRAAKANVVA